MTEEEKKAAEASVQATALEEQKKKDAELNAKSPEQVEIEKLRKEKEEILVREANYKLAYLKEARKNEGNGDPVDEPEDERIRRIYREEQAKERLSQIDSAERVLLEKTLKENHELRLAQQNKPAASPTGGSSSEQISVTSTVITNDQLAAFKARGWSDKDIERYKKNLSKNTR